MQFKLDVTDPVMLVKMVPVIGNLFIIVILMVGTGVLQKYVNNSEAVMTLAAAHVVLRGVSVLVDV